MSEDQEHETDQEQCESCSQDQAEKQSPDTHNSNCTIVTACQCKQSFNFATTGK